MRKSGGYPKCSAKPINVKKRLRKKKHKGEFAEFGRKLVVKRNTDNDFDTFLDRFIDIVEKSGCSCGGGGGDDYLDMVVQLGRRQQNPDQRIKAIESELRKDATIASIQIGEEFDLWYGDFDNLFEKNNAEQ